MTFQAIKSSSSEEVKEYLMTKADDVYPFVSEHFQEMLLLSGMFDPSCWSSHWTICDCGMLLSCQ